MKVYIRNKIISLGGSSEVLNEKKETIFKVKGKFLSFTKKKKMYDMEGKLLYTIRNKYWTGIYNQTFIYDENGDKVATIRKRKRRLNSDFEIIDTDDEMSIDGQFFGVVSKIMRNGNPVANIVREFSIMKDMFTLEADEKDIPFFTALVIGFDNIKDNISKQKD